MTRLALELRHRREEIRGCLSSPDKNQNLKATELVAALLRFLPRVERALEQQCGPACLALSVKHRAFVHAKILGPQPLSDTEAYLAAYPTAKRTSAGVAGHRLLKNAKISAAIAEHERVAAAATVDEREELAQIMRRIYLLDSSASHRDRIGAGNLRANMEPGWKAPAKLEISAGDHLAQVVIDLAKAGIPRAVELVSRWRPSMTLAEQVAWVEEGCVYLTETAQAQAALEAAVVTAPDKS